MAVGSPAACMYGFGFSCHLILGGFFLFLAHRLCFNGMALDFLATQYFWYFFLFLIDYVLMQTTIGRKSSDTNQAL